MENLQILKDKIVSFEQLPALLNQWELKEEKIVFTNGCFDILHQGHIDYLAKASDLGTKLIVGVNSDSSVRTLNKGTNRPLQDEESRAMIIAALHVVDKVIIFDDSTPLNLIEQVKPKVLVKGSDYSIKEIVGHEVVLENGGEVIPIDFLPGHSTSSIINRACE